jgi:hypothetical protein
MLSPLLAQNRRHKRQDEGPLSGARPDIIIQQRRSYGLPGAPERLEKTNRSNAIGGASREYLRTRLPETSVAPDMIHEVVTSGTARSASV